MDRCCWLQGGGAGDEGFGSEAAGCVFCGFLLEGRGGRVACEGDAA
jgi:hypothetical protein